MFTDYGNELKIQFKIYSADDNADSHNSVNVNVFSTYKIRRIQTYSRRSGRYVQRDSYPYEIIDDKGDSRIVIPISVARTGAIKGEPMVLAIKAELQRVLGWGGRGHRLAPKKFRAAFVFPNTPGLSILIEKGEPYYSLMGSRITKKNLMMNLSRILYRACFTNDGVALLQSLYTMIDLPENVSYVLENKTPYWFFNVNTREKIEVRLNTILIGDKECALELSDGVWAPISVKDLDIFVNYFYHGHTRAKKWAYVSPKKLWQILMGKAPTKSQSDLMVEYLSQNRTQDIVERRAEQLMQSLTVKYPDRIKIINVNAPKGEDNKKSYSRGNKDEFTIMMIKGQLCDWVIIDSTYKTQIQKVKTYVFIHEQFLPKKENYTNNFLNGTLQGPICIDNIHDNSSVGDQYAARALALLNDKTTVKLVNTIGRYIPKEITEKGKESRFDFENVPNENWRVII